MANERSTAWRYAICGLLLLATMLNYMDRQTLSQLATTICEEYRLKNEDYGQLDSGFSLAFAAGALFFGLVVDRVGPRWLYPAVLVGWSAAGLGTAYAEVIGAWMLPDASASDQTYRGFMTCRIVLGFFESGHWPCALVTTQTILARNERPLGNSLLQSGAAIGAIVTPLIVLALLDKEPGGWQPPFVVVGCLGFLWILPWLILTRANDFDRHLPDVQNLAELEPAQRFNFRRFAVLMLVVLCINITWQFFRVWLPKCLEEWHGYSKSEVGWFTSAYYISTDVGCIGVGFLVKWLVGMGWDVHRARHWTFSACSGLTFLGVAVAFLPKGWLLLVVLLIVGAGSLGLFPNYYSFTQELSKKRQGLVTGVLSTTTWVGTAIMQSLVGRNIDETKSYATGILVAALTPLLACAALWLFWNRKANLGPRLK